MESWTLAVARADHADVTLLDTPVPEPADGQAVLRPSRVGLTANNVTYAILGDAFRYWDFFPAPRPDLGLVPLWGFADVVASRAEGVAEGQRYYGYLPPAGHLLVSPVRATERGFRDATPHRAPLPAAYNAYALTTGDAAYEADREDLQVLFRPLFFTSFVLADWLLGVAASGETFVVGSASSKTAYGTAFLLRDSGHRLVGLTAAVDFTESLGLYDAVLPYDAVGSLPAGPARYLDFAGRRDVREAVRDRLGAEVVGVGLTHQAVDALDDVQVFFAPEQMRTRSAEWGPGGLAARFGAAWHAFAPAASGWVDVVPHAGPEALRDTWLAVLAGRTAPREGHVVTF